MKAVQVELMSFEELAKKGFKADPKDGALFLGSSRYPTSKVDPNLIPLLGQKIDIVDYRTSDWGEDHKLYVSGADGSKERVPHAIIRNPLNKIKGLSVRKTIVGKEVAEFNGFCFRFPCETRDLPTKEAIRLAKWVLEMAK